MSVIANPFANTRYDWAFYVLHESGQILAMSNSAEWCEWFIAQQA